MNRLLQWVPLSVLVCVLMAANALAAPEPKKTEGASTLVQSGLSDTAGAAGYTGTSIPTLVGNTIQALLSVVGIIFLVLVVYGGFLYMTDLGEGTKVKKAKSIIATSLIGIVIVLAAYAFTQFVIDALVEASKATKQG